MGNEYSGKNPLRMLTRVIELYKEGGITEIKRGVNDYLFGGYYSTRTDNEFRWEFIRQYITDTDHTLLDIGCAEGYFCLRASEMGLSVTGIDMNESRIEKARQLCPDGEFKTLNITPNNINELPDVDVTLVLTVHHWWASEFGWETAASMLQTLMKSTRLLVYEPPGDQYIHPSISTNQSMIEYYKAVLKNVDPRVEIVGMGKTDYKDGERIDPLYVLDCTNIQ